MKHKNNKIRRLEIFFKIVVLKNFSLFTGKHLCWSFFLISFHFKRNFEAPYHRIKKQEIFKQIQEQPRRIFRCVIHFGLMVIKNSSFKSVQKSHKNIVGSHESFRFYIPWVEPSVIRNSHQRCSIKRVF